MGIQRDLGMQKVLHSTIFSVEFIGIPSDKMFEKAVRYIHDNKSWERCYILLKIIFPCIIFLNLVDSSHAGMGKYYYYLRITKQCIEKIISDIYY